MSNDPTKPRQLDAVRRWHDAELEEARAEFTHLADAAAKQQAEIQRIESEVDAARSFARELSGAATPLNPDALLRWSQFSVHQQQHLQAARDDGAKADQQADTARVAVGRAFERLSVIERLMQRRQEQAGRQEHRELQKRLDEGALSRVSVSRRVPADQE